MGSVGQVGRPLKARGPVTVSSCSCRSARFFSSSSFFFFAAASSRFFCSAISFSRFCSFGSISFLLNGFSVSSQDFFFLSSFGALPSVAASPPPSPEPAPSSAAAGSASFSSPAIPPRARADACRASDRAAACCRNVAFFPGGPVLEVQRGYTVPTCPAQQVSVTGSLQGPLSPECRAPRLCGRI